MATDVSVRSTKVAEPNVGGIDGVDACEHGHERLAHATACSKVKMLRGIGPVVQSAAAHLGHDVKMTVAHRTVVAIADRLSDRNAHRVKRLDDPVLAEHVVCLRQEVALRGPANDELSAVAVRQQVREIGVTARETSPPTRRRDSSASSQPRLDQRHIESNGRLTVLHVCSVADHVRDRTTRQCQTLTA